MKIYADVEGLEALARVVSRHGEALHFNITYFRRKSFQGEYDVFAEINQYWATLTKEAQDRIFEAYRASQEIFDNLLSGDEHENRLMQVVRTITNEHKLDDLRHWIERYSDLQVPESCAAEFKENIDLNNTREKTYTRNDYLELVSLAIGMRALIPVLGVAINEARQKVGNDYKEEYAFKLLQESAYMVSSPMKKLKQYIEAFLRDTVLDPKRILSGVTSESYPTMLCARICIKRLTVGDIRGKDREHMISFMHLEISTRFDSRNSDVGTNVKEKRLPEIAGEADNKGSTLERYRIKTELSIGDITELEFAVNDPYSLLDSICPGDTLVDGIPYDKSIDLTDALTHTTPLLSFKVYNPTITLLQWLFKDIISPRGLPYLSKNKIIQLIAVGEVVLWHNDFKYLAALLSSHVVKGGNDVMLVSPMDSRYRIPQELLDEVEYYFPYKRLISRRRGLDVEENPAMEAVHLLAKNFSDYTWSSTLPANRLSLVQSGRSKRLVIKPDIKTEIVKLMLAAVKGQFKNKIV